jgi:hypothetical protein
MVDTPDIAVAIPPIGNIEAVEFREIGVRQAAVVSDAQTIEADVDEDAEEFPIVVGIVEFPRAEQIGDEIVSRPAVQRIPQFFGDQGESETDGSEFDHALVAIVDPAPEFRMVRIGTVRDAVGKTLPMAEIAATGGKRRKAPKRPRKAFEIGSGPIEVGAGRIKTHACIPL